MSTGAKELGELIYQLGVQHANFQNEIAKKIDRAMAKAFDDGFALGRETGYQDAAKDVVDTDPRSCRRPTRRRTEHRARNTRPGDVSRKRRFELPGAESGGPLLFRRIRPVRSGGRL